MELAASRAATQLDGLIERTISCLNDRLCSGRSGAGAKSRGSVNSSAGNIQCVLKFKMRKAIHRLGRWYVKKLLESEAAAQKAQPINERPIELSFLFNAIRELEPSRVLDVGVGQSPLPALIRNCGCTVVAIDNIKDYWPGGMINRHWLVQNEDIRCPTLPSNSFDLITCISVIEHIMEPERAFRSMLDLLHPAGHLVLTTPYNEGRYVEDVYRLPGFTGNPGEPYRCSSYDRPTLERWLASTTATILKQEYWRIWEGDVWRQGERLITPEKTSAEAPHQLTCLLIKK